MGCEQCIAGYEWRNARAGSTDNVCVTTAERARAAAQNAGHAALIEPDATMHQYGPNTCRQGYVWRDAWMGDEICVMFEERDIAARQNAEHGIHTVVGAP
jgi:hypothetical protein